MSAEREIQRADAKQHLVLGLEAVLFAIAIALQTVAWLPSTVAFVAGWGVAVKFGSKPQATRLAIAATLAFLGWNLFSHIPRGATRVIKPAIK